MLYIVAHTVFLLQSESDDEGDVSDECESCGERADVYCVDCHSSRCHLCNEQWHKHPKRKHHQTKVNSCTKSHKTHIKRLCCV